MIQPHRLATQGANPSRRADVRRPIAASLAVLLLSSFVVLGTSTAANADTLVGAGIVLLQDGTGQGTANGCLVQDPDSSLADKTGTDGIVCTDDNVTYGWNYSIAAAGAEDVVLSQTLPAGWTWDALSLTSCEGGTDFVGVGVLSNGGLTLTCTLQFAPTGSARSGQLPVFATPQPGIADGSTYSAVLDASDDNVTINTSPPATQVTVRSQPRWNLIKGPAGVTHDREADFGSGIEPAAKIGYLIEIAAQTANNFKGQDSLGPIAFTDIVTGIDPKAMLDDCPRGNNTAVMTCTQTAPGADIQFTMSNMDVPALSIRGPGTATAYISYMTILVPESTLPIYPLNRLTVNQFVGFDPNGTSSGSNLGAGFENGSEDGAVCVSGNSNDNCAYINVNTSSGFGVGTAKSLRRDNRTPNTRPECGQWWWCEPLDGATGTSSLNDFRTGNQDGIAFRGDNFGAGFAFSFAPALPQNRPANVTQCDVWDPALQQYDDDGFAGSSWEGYWNSSYGRGKAQFTTQAFADDTARENADCGTWSDLSDGPWYAAIGDVPGGEAAVSGIRWQIDTSSPVNSAGGYDYLIPMKVGANVAVGTAVPDFAHLYFDQQRSTANPDGWTFVNRDSYFVADLKLGLNKDTVPAGRTGAVVGARVSFSLQPSTSLAPPASPRVVTGLNVVDTLDPCFVEPQLDPSVTGWSMAVTSPGDRGPDGIACTADDVSGATLTFTPLSAATTNAPLEQIVYSVLISTFAKNGQKIVNTATVDTAPGVTQQSLAGRTDDWTLTVAAPGAVRVSKVADFPLVEIEPDDLSWTIQYSNTLGQTLGETVLIDLLPYNGDGRGTAFHGQFGFAGAAVVSGNDTVVQYTTDAVGTILTDPSLNTSTWVNASAYAGNLANVTAIRIVVNDLTLGEIGAVRITASPSGNLEGDVYDNDVAAGRSVGLLQPIPPTLISQIRVVASSIGDRVWSDLNADGIQDASEPGLVGVKVNLLDAGGAVIDSTVTGANGIYTFGNRHSGTYRVQVDKTTLPAGFRATYDLDSGTTSPDSDSQNFALGFNVDRTDVDFGYVDVPRLVVSKVVAGPGPAGPYTFVVTCTLDGEAFALSAADSRFQLSHGQSRTITVQAGVDCTVRESDAPSGATVTYLDSDASTPLGVKDGVVTDIQGEATVKVTNAFPPTVISGETPRLGATGLSLETPLIGGLALLLSGMVLMLIRRRRQA